MRLNQMGGKSTQLTWAQRGRPLWSGEYGDQDINDRAVSCRDESCQKCGYIVCGCETIRAQIEMMKQRQIGFSETMRLQNEALLILAEKKKAANHRVKIDPKVLEREGTARYIDLDASRPRKDPWHDPDVWAGDGSVCRWSLSTDQRNRAWSFEKSGKGSAFQLFVDREYVTVFTAPADGTYTFAVVNDKLMVRFEPSDVYVTRDGEHYSKDRVDMRLNGWRSVPGSEYSRVDNCRLVEKSLGLWENIKDGWTVSEKNKEREGLRGECETFRTLSETPGITHDDLKKLTERYRNPSFAESPKPLHQTSQPQADLKVPEFAQGSFQPQTEQRFPGSSGRTGARRPASEDEAEQMLAEAHSYVRGEASPTSQERPGPRPLGLRSRAFDRYLWEEPQASAGDYKGQRWSESEQRYLPHLTNGD